MPDDMRRRDFPACDPSWNEFSQLIEAEVKRREQIASDVQSDSHTTLLFPAALAVTKFPQSRKDVESIQQPTVELLKIA